MAPRCAELPEFRRNPHAWVKLWKHHGAQPEADRINNIAAALGEKMSRSQRRKVSPEWFIPKAMQILNEAPEVYRASGVCWKLPIG